MGELVSEGAICKFLDENGYDILLRGHEAVRDGLDMGLSGRVFTVFGATNYLKSGNCEGAVVVLYRAGEMHLKMYRSDFP